MVIDMRPYVGSFSEMISNWDYTDHREGNAWLNIKRVRHTELPEYVQSRASNTQKRKASASREASPAKDSGESPQKKPRLSV